MTEPVPLIVDEAPSGALGATPPLRPGLAAVHTAADGSVIGAQGRPSNLRERLAVKHRFVVDVSDKESRFLWQLPAQGDYFDFAAVVDVSWRVDRPWVVVQRNIRDGRRLLETRLEPLLRAVTRTFEKHQAAHAEEAINKRFGDTPGRLPEGIAIHRCFARLSIDAARIAAEREYERALHDNRIAETRQVAIQRAMAGDPSGITYHLSQNPGDAKTVIDYISRNREIDFATRLKLLDQLGNNGALHEMDLAEIRRGLLSNLTELSAGSGQQPRQVEPGPPPSREDDEPAPYDGPAPYGEGESWR